MTKPDGGPAFPVPGSFIRAPAGSDRLFTNADEYGCGPILGMSLADWFAGQALAGIMASACGNMIDADAPERAKYAYYQAYVMLAVRSKTD